MVKITERRSKLIEDAQASGYEVLFGNISIFFTKRGKSKMILYEDGTAITLDIPTKAIKVMQSYNEMRRVLGIKKEN